MDELRITDISWRGRPAWLLAAPGLEVVVTRCGAQLACIRHPGEEANALWQPPWPAAAPEAADPGIHGDDGAAGLLANIVGHNPCIDRFGAPHPGEDKPPHGEAGVLDWTPSCEATALELGLSLPVAGLHLTRRHEISGQELQVSTRIRHDEATPRAIEWAEHVTLGPPFIDAATIEAPVDGAWLWDGEPQATWRFQSQDADLAVDPAAALALPRPDDPPAGDIITTRLSAGSFTATDHQQGHQLTYTWDAAVFPWLCLWTQHRSRQAPPWNGQTRTRGLEFATKPFPDGLPPPERARSWQGRPTTCLVPPGEGLSTCFTVRWTRSL